MRKQALLLFFTAERCTWPITGPQDTQTEHERIHPTAIYSILGLVQGEYD